MTLDREQPLDGLRAVSDAEVVVPGDRPLPEEVTRWGDSPPRLRVVVGDGLAD